MRHRTPQSNKLYFFGIGSFILALALAAWIVAVGQAVGAPSASDQVTVETSNKPFRMPVSSAAKVFDQVDAHPIIVEDLPIRFEWGGEELCAATGSFVIEAGTPAFVVTYGRCPDDGV